MIRAENRVEDKLATVEKNFMGMIAFLYSEIAFFSILIAAFIYYHGSYPHDPSSDKALEPVKAGIFTICLIASSFTIYFAERSLRKSNWLMLRVWLFITLVLGAIFLIGQGSEYIRLFSENITVSRNLFGATFFTLTGFHGFHVFGGLCMISILFILSMIGHFKRPHSPALETISIYWHFVDVVWIIIFNLIYTWSLFS